MNPLDLLQEFVSLPGTPGQEVAIRDAVAAHVANLGIPFEVDSKGSLIVRIGQNPDRILVTAHLDEIAMIVRRVEANGVIVVGPLGGIFPWKAGEGPVQILGTNGYLNGVLSFGSIHTADPSSVVRQADTKAISWDMVRVLTGLSKAELHDKGVRPGTRVVIHPNRRQLFPVGNLISGYFLDDRADLVSWLLALVQLKDSGVSATFAATAAEEVGGEGALWIMEQIKPEVCIALELGPNTVDAPVEITDAPTVWTTDSYSTMSASDGELVDRVAKAADISIQFQSLSRGGSDASCGAGHGLNARPITLGLAMDNSHGYEIMHPNAMQNLADLTVALLREIS